MPSQELDCGDCHRLPPAHMWTTTYDHGSHDNCLQTLKSISRPVICARHADGVHRRFGARTCKAHHIHRRTHIHDHLGDLDFKLTGHCEQYALFYFLDDLRIHLIICVAKNNRAECHSVINKAAPIYIPKIGAFGFIHIRREAFTPISEIGIHAQWQNFFGAFLQ